MKRVFLTMLALACLIFPARAEDVKTVDVSAEASVSMDESYLRLTCPLDGEEQVTIAVADSRGNLQYQRDYGLCSGTFRSEDIYLRLNGSETVYLVSVQAGDAAYELTVNRVMPRLRGNAACAVGYPLSWLNGSSSWYTVTILDVNALEGSSTTVALHASDAYELGTVTFKVSSGKLKVSASIGNGFDGSIDGSTVSVATNALQAEQLGSRHFAGLTARLDESVDLGGTPYVAVLVNLTVSFDPSGVPGSPDTYLDGQEELWTLMQQMTANEAVG